MAETATKIQTLISVREAAQFLPMTPASLYVAIRGGEIPGVVKIGGRVFLNRNRFLQFLNGDQQQVA